MDAERRIGGGGGSAIDVVHGGRRRRLRRLIWRQHGAITHAQLLAAGVGRGAIARRLKAGRLTVIHRGVYLVGPISTPKTSEMAAVLACQPDAFVSHESAAYRHGLTPLSAQPDPVHATVNGRNPRSRADIRLHRAKLADDETMTVYNVPITTPARTILDLAAILTTPDLEQLMAEAYAAKRTSRRELRRLVARYPGRPGIPALRAIAVTTPRRTRSRPERMLLTLIRKAGLPEPLVNTQLHGYEVDLLWPDHRLVVEFDGHAFHAPKPKRGRDSRRDQDLILRGYVVLRVTWHQLTSEPEALIARIATAVAQRGPSSLRTAAQ